MQIFIVRMGLVITYTHTQLSSLGDIIEANIDVVRGGTAGPVYQPVPSNSPSMKYVDMTWYYYYCRL